MRDTRHYKAIVVGLGAMGSATLYHLAQRGARALGLEQFAAGHTRGSSHGDSRIIRETYFEHPLYVPLVQRAHELWRELEQRSGDTLMTITGGLMIGPPDGVVVSGTLRSAREHGLPHSILSPLEVRKRFPAFQLADDLIAVLDPRAGFLDPEACTRAHIQAALVLGAEARFNEAVIDWTVDGDSVNVTTGSGEYSADTLVLSAGAWNQRLLPDIVLPLVVERQSVFWLDPESDSPHYDLGSLPIYAYEYRAGNICYGFPRLPRGVKASVMHAGETVTDPDDVNRSIGAAEVKPLRAALRPILPSLAEAPVRESDVCLFTNTPDRDFIIDFHPFLPQVLISSPCSGHGFKFSSAVGEIQADLLTTGKSAFDLSPFRIGRWAG
jgi:sarcosine oxidase